MAAEAAFVSQAAREGSSSEVARDSLVSFLEPVDDDGHAVTAPDELRLAAYVLSADYFASRSTVDRWLRERSITPSRVTDGLFSWLVLLTDKPPTVQTATLDLGSGVQALYVQR